MLARTVGEADAAGLPARAGATSTRAWLTGRHGMSARDASRAVAQARAMTPAAEPTRLAWARGEVCGDRAEAIAHTVNGLPDGVDPHRVEAAQAGLLARSRTLSFAELRSVRRPGWSTPSTPSGAAARVPRRSGSRRLRAVDLPAPEGTRRRRVVLRHDAEPGRRHAAREPRRHRLPAPRPPPRPRTGRQTADERVPYADRLGRALCDLVERVDARGLRLGDGVNATLVVTVDEQSLRARVGAAALSSGDEITVSEARRLACSADILPAVLGGESRVLDLGRARRLFSPAPEDRARRQGRRLRVRRLRTLARMDPGPPRRPLVRGRDDRPRQRRPALRRPPPPHPPRRRSRRLADPDRRRRTSPKPSRPDASTPNAHPSATADTDTCTDDATEDHPAPKPPDTPSAGRSATPATPAAPPRPTGRLARTLTTQ